LESYINSKAFNLDLIIVDTSGSDEGRSATVPCIVFNLYGDFFNNNNCCFDDIIAAAAACAVDVDTSDAIMGLTVDVDAAVAADRGRVISDSIGGDNDVCLDDAIDCFCCRPLFRALAVEIILV
jgi:hypothetical protein